MRGKRIKTGINNRVVGISRMKLHCGESSAFRSNMPKPNHKCISIENDALLPHVAMYWVHLLHVEALLVRTNARIGRLSQFSFDIVF